jgi:hypothetical protein
MAEFNGTSDLLNLREDSTESRTRSPNRFDGSYGVFFNEEDFQVPKNKGKF